MRLTILFLGAMLGILVVAGGVAFAANGDCYDTGHGWACQCPQNGGLCTGTNIEEGETIYGSDYNDTIYAYGGHDDIRGDWGDDKIYGGPGNDYIEGNDDKDTCRGGSGYDIANTNCEIRVSIEEVWEE